MEKKWREELGITRLVKSVVGNFFFIYIFFLKRGKWVIVEENIVELNRISERKKGIKTQIKCYVEGRSGAVRRQISNASGTGVRPWEAAVKGKESPS